MRHTLTADDGTRLSARRTGRGTPVVLVHGSAGGLDSWEHVVPLLADAFEVWVYARRGYQPSDGCRQPKTYADDTSDLQAVIAAAGGSAHVVGVSYGATVVLHAARANGTGIRSAALFEPPLFAAGSATADVLPRYRALVESGDLAAATRLFAEQVARVPQAVVAALAAETPTAAPDPAREAVALAEAVGCVHDLEAMTADTPDIPRRADITVPVLLMSGGDTWAPMPATMAALADALPDATRVVWPGQSHFVTYTAPDLFAEAVRGFLSTRR